MNKKVLLVDDDQFLRTMLNGVLKKLGIVDADQAGGGAEAIEMLKKKAYNLVITDIQMPNIDGFGVLASARDLHPDIKVLMISGAVDIDPNSDARKSPDKSLGKPFLVAEFKDAVSELLGL